MTTFSDMLYQLGGVPALAGIPFGPKSKYYFVDPTNGDDANPGTDLAKPLAGLEAAYAKTVSGQHDCVFYIAGTTTTSFLAAMVWANSYTHLIGICAPSHVAQRARVNQESVVVSPLLTVSGSGCIFKNLYFFHGVNSASSLINVKVTGERNYFYNVHFAGGGHTTQAIDGGMSLQISGGSENLFERCTIGVDTIAAATGMVGLSFAATGGAARNWFKDCHFSMYAGSATALFVEVLGNSGIDRYQIFERCLFSNLSATAMTEAINVAAGFDANNKRLLLLNCALIGATDWDASNRGAIYLNNGTLTGGGNAGTMLVSNAT